VTDLSDYKKIGDVPGGCFMNIIYIYLSQTRWSTEHTHTQTIILLHLKIFQYDLKWNTFTHGKLPHRRKDQPHVPAIALDKFLVLWNAKLRLKGKWHLGSISWLSSWLLTSGVARGVRVPRAALFSGRHFV